MDHGTVSTWTILQGLNLGRELRDNCENCARKSRAHRALRSAQARLAAGAADKCRYSHTLDECARWWPCSSPAACTRCRRSSPRRPVSPTAKTRPRTAPTSPLRTMWRKPPLSRRLRRSTLVTGCWSLGRSLMMRATKRSAEVVSQEEEAMIWTAFADVRRRKDGNSLKSGTPNVKSTRRTLQSTRVPGAERQPVAGLYNRLRESAARISGAAPRARCVPSGRT